MIKLYLRQSNDSGQVLGDLGAESYVTIASVSLQGSQPAHPPFRYAHSSIRCAHHSIRYAHPLARVMHSEGSMRFKSVYMVKSSSAQRLVRELHELS